MKNVNREAKNREGMWSEEKDWQTAKRLVSGLEKRNDNGVGVEGGGKRLILISSEKMKWDENGSLGDQ